MTKTLKNMIDELAKFDLNSGDDPRWVERRIKELKREADKEYNPYKIINVDNLIENIWEENKKNTELCIEIQKEALAEIIYGYTARIVHLIKEEVNNIKEKINYENY